MATTPTFPGVYIVEVPSGVRTIAGVATSIGAFIDVFRRGPLNEAVQIFSFADFERAFGGLHVRSDLFCPAQFSTFSGAQVLAMPA